MSRTRTALLLPARGTQPAVLRDLPIDDLARLQQLVGGDIEVVRLGAAQRARAEIAAGEVLGNPGDVYLVCNEMGKLQGLPPNALAALIMGPGFADVIVGDAFVVEMPPDEEVEPGMVQLPAATQQLLNQLLGAAQAVADAKAQLERAVFLEEIEEAVRTLNTAATRLALQAVEAGAALGAADVEA